MFTSTKYVVHIMVLRHVVLAEIVLIVGLWGAPDWHANTPHSGLYLPKLVRICKDIHQSIYIMGRSFRQSFHMPYGEGASWPRVATTSPLLNTRRSAVEIRKDRRTMQWSYMTPNSAPFTQPHRWLSRPRCKEDVTVVAYIFWSSSSTSKGQKLTL